MRTLLTALGALSLLVPTVTQANVGPGPFVEEEVAFTSGGITLAGTLTLPEGAGPHPAVVTITGSGPQDRDNAHPSIPDYRPFAWLAEHLSARGVAVLRYDERGVGESEGEFEGATSVDFAADVEAALAYLTSRPDIDDRQLGLVGHSEGSMIAGMVAARHPAVSFVVSLAGAAVDGFTLMRDQIANLAFTQAPTEEFAEFVVRMEIRAMELTLAEEWDALEAHLAESYRTQFEMLPEEGRPPEDQIEPLARQTAAQQVEATYRDPWYQFFLRHDPSQDWERVTVPALVLFGEHDLQVDPALNAGPFEEALRRAGNPDASVVVVDDANHLFLEIEDGGVLEYPDLEMAFVPGLLDLITDWVVTRVTTGRP